MSYSAASIANAFLSHGFEAKRPITPMKIQKFVYLAHGHALVERPQPIINEFFEAWKFGPVLPSLYHECKRYGPNAITDYVRDLDLQTWERFPASIPDDPHVQEIVEFVWQAYGGYAASTLSDWTHAKGGPWDEVTQGGTLITRGQDIGHELIKKYFTENVYEGDDLFGEETAQEANHS